MRSKKGAPKKNENLVTNELAINMFQLKTMNEMQELAYLEAKYPKNTTENLTLLS